MSSTCWVWTIRRSKRLRSSRFHHSRIRLGSVAPSHSLWFQPAHLGKVLPQHLPRTGHFDTLSARLTAPPCQTTCHCYVMSQNVLGSPTGWMISLLRTWITKWCCMLLHATACYCVHCVHCFGCVSLRFSQVPVLLTSIALLPLRPHWIRALSWVTAHDTHVHQLRDLRDLRESMWRLSESMSKPCRSQV